MRKNNMIIVVVSMVLALAVLTISRQADAQRRIPTPVTEQHPLPIRGTVTVTAQDALPVRGTVAVTAQDALPVRGTVAVTAQDALPVRGTVAVTAQDETSPVLVRDVENPARHPFMRTHSAIWNSDDLRPVALAVTIPTGKRLVVEQISVNAQVTCSPSQGVHVEIESQADGGMGSYALVATNTGKCQFIASGQLRLYAESNSELRILLFRNDSIGSSSVVVSITGYLIDQP
jgi:hypothetical protein